MNEISESNKKFTIPNLKTPDQWLLFGSLIYVILPIIIFFFGWMKLPLAILFSAAFIFLLYKLQDGFQISDSNLFTKENRVYWLTTAAIIFFWTYLSGIGGFTFQNSDYWVRNPIFNDLSNLKWPVFYDLSTQTAHVQSFTGNDTVAFSYYFTWWLPVAAISKIFSLGDSVRNLLLLLWAAAGVFLVVYCLNRLFGKCSHWITAVLIFFSGLDIVMYCLMNSKLPHGSHIEWWAKFFQYSSNTTQLFWVFNQTIPIWLIVCLFLLLNNNRYSAGICSLVFAYSPWGTFGVVPYAIASSFRKKETIKEIFNPANIIIPIIMLITYGSFYMSSSGSTGSYGLVFSLYPNVEKQLIFTYFVFLLIEFGVYYLAAGKHFQKYEYYWVTLIQLLLFPLFYIRDFNFCMRGCIPALFVTMVYVIRFIFEQSEDFSHKLRKGIVCALLVIGAFTSISEIERTVQQTLKSNDFTQDQFYSFNNLETDKEHYITTAKNQFFIYNYEDSFFFKYLSKK